MAAEELGQRVQYNIGAIVDGTHQYGCRHGIVDDERHSGPMCHIGDRFKITDVAGRVAHRFAEESTSIFIDQCFKIDRLIGLGEADRDAEPRQHVSEQGMGRAIKLWHGNDVSAGIRNIQRRIIQRGLPGAHAQGGRAAFEQSHTLFEHCIGGISDAGIPVAVDFEIEQSRAVLRTVEGIGHGLIDRHRDGSGGGIGVETAMQRNSLVFHLP